MFDATLRESAAASAQQRPTFHPVIEEAKCILMAEHDCTPDEAFDLLRRVSKRINVKVLVLATRLVEQAGSADASGAVIMRGII